MKKYINTSSASFPLGGIGAGSVGLCTNGALCNWEIFNRPDRGTVNPFSHFAIKAERDGKVLDFRVLQGDFAGDAMGRVGTERGEMYVYGNGIDRGTMAGVKHFESAEFSAFYPMAKIDFSDKCFPGRVTLRALSPFIPMNAFDSSLSCAFFEIEAENTSDSALDYTVAFTVNNLFGGARQNEKTEISGAAAMYFDSDEAEDSPRFGNMTVLCPDGHVSFQEHWYRGGWFDELCTFIRDFSALGDLKNRTYGEPSKCPTDAATLASRITLEKGERGRVRFILCWYAPNFIKYWDARRQKMKNYMSAKFASSKEIAAYCLENYRRLWDDTELFVRAFESQTLPDEIKEAVQASFAVLKSTVCVRLADGTLWGWEGVTEKSGSCEGSCTHVWNYAQLAAFLFPELERSMREAEYRYSVDGDGKMAFRLLLPPGECRSNFRACADGQMGTVIKTYREWKLGAGDGFIRSKWEKIKSLVSYAWSEKNPDRWDPAASGILSGRCHHTLDMELFGASSWLQGYYLGALKACAEMADALGDHETKTQFEKIFERGKAASEAELFNGEYYCQEIDLYDLSVLDGYDMGELINSDGYRNEEAGELKYQIGDGLAITAVAGDWQSRCAMLGPVFDEEHTRSTLGAMMKYNFKSMREVNNPCRVFAADGERGLIICSWDGAARRPAIPLTYAEECMTGFEYAAASAMTALGMTKEARLVVGAVRDRYTGGRRDPWAELECGASYARSMASYTLVTAYSGFFADLSGEKRIIGFAPAEYGEYFWSLDGAWGTVKCSERGISLQVLWGETELSCLAYSRPVDSLRFNGKPLDCLGTESAGACPEYALKFEKLRLSKGDCLEARV